MSNEASSSKNTLRLLAALAVLIGGIILLTVTECASVPDVPAAPPAQTGALAPANMPAPREASILADNSAAGGSTVARAFGAGHSVRQSTSLEGRSPLADKLNDPAQTVRQDLQIVAELFANYREELQEMPVGNNAEITAALAGDNAMGHAPLPDDHRAINAGGELTDRWSTPFFFHQLAGDLMEIRSAGPDRRMHTDDDVVWPQATEIAGAAQ